jgi:hypothetical protein
MPDSMHHSSGFENIHVSWNSSFQEQYCATVYFYNISSCEFLGFPTVQLRPPFLWDMALCNWVTSTPTFWDNRVVSKCWAPIIGSHPRRAATSHLKFCKHIFLIIKLFHFNFMLAYHFKLFCLFQKPCLEAVIPVSSIMVEIPPSP